MRQWDDYEPSGSSAGTPGQPSREEVPRLLQAEAAVRHRRSWVARHKFFTVVAGVGGMVCVAGVASAAQSPKSTADPAAVASSAAGGCPAQVRAWANGGAVELVGSFSGDLGAFATKTQAFAADLGAGDASASDVAGVRSAAAALRSAARGVAVNPGPPCVPGLRADLAAAAGDYENAAAAADQGMSRYTVRDVAGAASEITAASSALANGNIKLARATAALSRYGASQGG